MKKKKKKKFDLLSLEKYGEKKLSSNDEAVLKSAETGEGMIKVTPEMFKDMQRQAKITWEHFDFLIRPMMTEERAKEVKELRMVKQYSWRLLANYCHMWWQGQWNPPSNQLAGMKICQIAGELLKEKID